MVCGTPERSHRLRDCFPGERECHPGSAANSSPPFAHRWQVLVQQAEPGKRLRLPFLRDARCPIPDCEPILHAMFDLYSVKRTPRGSPITVAEVAALAMTYATAKERPQ